MKRRLNAVYTLAGVVVIAAILAALLVIQIPMSRAAEAPPVATTQGEEKIVLLRELEPLRDTTSLERVLRGVVGGVIWNDVLQPRTLAHAGDYVVWDTGGAYDLFEGYFGIDDAAGCESARLLVTGDGERIASLSLRRGEKAQFFWFSLKGCRAVQLTVMELTGEAHHLFMIANGRLVKGRTTPSHPRDLYIDDGETVYIEQPGEYTFHVRAHH